MPTLFDIDALRIDSAKGEQSAAIAAGRSAYAQRLAAALGDGSRWEYRDECTDLGGPVGRCACGHEGIRFAFTLHNRDDGRRVTVGSTCVTTYPGITPETVARLAADAERMDKAIADAKRAARERARDAEIQSLLADWSAAEYAVDEACQRWRDSHSDWYVPFLVYRRGCYGVRLAERQDGKPHPYVKLPALKSQAGIAKRIRRAIEHARRTMNEVRGLD